MAPPPITPSPRRFLQPSKPKTQPRPSRLSSSLATPSAAPSLSSTQFAPTPRFSAATQKKQKKAIDDIESPTSSPLATRTRPPAPKATTGESIDDESPRRNTGANVSSAELEPPHTESTQAPDFMADDFDVDFDFPPPKRRRLTPSPPPHLRAAEPILVSSSPPQERSPSVSPSPSSPIRTRPLAGTAAAASERNATTHSAQSAAATRFRFVPDPALARTTPATKDSSSLSHRQAFLLSDLQSKPTDPSLGAHLPTVMGGSGGADRKFLPGGLAHLVRDWIVGARSSSETAARHPFKKHNRREAARGIPKDDYYFAASFVVDEVHNEDGMGLMTVRAAAASQDSSSGEERKPSQKDWLLIGKDGYGFKEQREVRKGDVVGVAAPVWDVEISGRVWGVAASWSVRERVDRREKG